MFTDYDLNNQTVERVNLSDLISKIEAIFLRGDNLGMTREGAQTTLDFLTNPEVALKLKIAIVQSLFEDRHEMIQKSDSEYFSIDNVALKNVATE